VKLIKIKKNKIKQPVLVFGVYDILPKPKIPLKMFWKVPKYISLDDSAINVPIQEQAIDLPALN